MDAPFAGAEDPTAADPSLDLSQAELEQLGMRNLLANSVERIYFKDLASRFLMVSAGWLAAYGGGRSLTDVLGRTDAEVFSHVHASEALADEQRIIATGEPLIEKVERETFPDRPDAWVSATKLPLRDGRGRVIGTYGISRDVTEQVYTQEKLARQALHDPVTGLANRVALMERLGQALIALERRPARVGVLYVDLDGFKEINDARGHDCGDRLLAAVGERLTLAVRRGDTVARFGGDEFVILVAEHEADDDNLRWLAGRVREALIAPLLRDDGIAVAASIGVAWTDDASTRPEELIARADAAMYAAKHEGRGGIHSDDGRPQATPAVVPELLAPLRDAIAGDELFVVYQPVVRLHDGALTGVEALVRWRHPTRGALTPDQFIPLAERHGLITAIDLKVMDAACRQLVAWQSADPSWAARVVAVNLSGRGLHEPRLAEHVLEILHRHSLDPARLRLEITETSLIGEVDRARHTIACLTDHGVGIALDDFGTGYSTLAHLQQLKAQQIKIDRSFTARVGREPRDREIVAAVIAMGHALGMNVVAEGVESELERKVLIELGCDEGQGYLFARPSDPDRIATLARMAVVSLRPLAAAA